MSTHGLPLGMNAPTVGATSRRTSLPWARWTAVLIGLAAVGGAGWVGYQQQLTAGSHDTSAKTQNAAAAAPPSPAGSGAAPAATASRSTAPVRLDAAMRRSGASVTAASAASQPELTWPLWEFQLRQPIPPRDPPLTPPSWRLVGATLSSDGWKVVILRQGNATPEYFGVGAVLPGGYKIQAITDEDVTFDINKREVILSYTGSR